MRVLAVVLLLAILAAQVPKITSRFRPAAVKASNCTDAGGSHSHSADACVPQGSDKNQTLKWQLPNLDALFPAVVPPSWHTKDMLRIGIFLQYGISTLDAGDHLLTCTQTVVDASPKVSAAVFDVHASFASASAQAKSNVQQVKKRLQAVGRFRHVLIAMHKHDDGNLGQFLAQLEVSTAKLLEYDLIFKMHAATDAIWRERAVESLCGTAAQVRSIWRQFSSERLTGMIAPLGTVFGPSTPVSRIFPHIPQKYGWTGDASQAFGSSVRSEMRRVHLIIDPGARPLSDEDIITAAGAMFWLRYESLRVPLLVRALPEVRLGYKSGGAKGLDMEQMLEQLLPTVVRTQGFGIADIQPAPKPIALYFPQYHRVLENDRFFYTNFTEWSLLRSFKQPPPSKGHPVGLQKPLLLSKGGLGYYDLLDRNTRQNQALLARAAGVYGFCMYHYWFSGKRAPKHHKVMFKVPELMLVDGEPNIPFMFSWANEPWTRRWTAHGPAPGYDNDQVMLSQEYGGRKEWEEHFHYLKPFFDHPSYVRVQGAPVIALYRIGHMGKVLEKMLQCWRQLATLQGYPGLHVVNTLGSYYKSDPNTPKLLRLPEIKAAFHFWPMLRGSGFTDTGGKAACASTADVSISTPVQYWGAYTGFDRRPRYPNAKASTPRTPAQFQRGLQASVKLQATLPARRVDTNFLFITAWNEWSEQAVMEPSHLHKFGYLQAVHRVISGMPVAWPHPPTNTRNTPALAPPI